MLGAWFEQDGVLIFRPARDFGAAVGYSSFLSRMGASRINNGRPWRSSVVLGVALRLSKGVLFCW